MIIAVTGYRGYTDGVFPRTDGVSIRVPGSGTWGCTIRAFELGIKVEIPAYTRSGEQ